MKFAIAIIIVLILGVVFLQSGQKIEKPALTITPPSTNNQQVDQLKIEDERVGTGSAVKIGDTITVNYKGTLLNGTQFDSSYDPGRQPFETQIGVGQVIKGWDMGLIGMKIGGKRKLTIPSNLAYGQQGAGSAIPPNSPLIFEIELLSIK